MTNEPEAIPEKLGAMKMRGHWLYAIIGNGGLWPLGVTILVVWRELSGTEPFFDLGTLLFPGVLMMTTTITDAFFMAQHFEKVTDSQVKEVGRLWNLGWVRMRWKSKRGTQPPSLLRAGVGAHVHSTTSCQPPSTASKLARGRRGD